MWDSEDNKNLDYCFALVLFLYLHLHWKLATETAVHVSQVAPVE